MGDNRTDQTTGLHLRGEVDVATLPSAELALELLLDTAGGVVVDLHDLTFPDVPGARALAATAIRLRSTGRCMHLHGTRAHIRRTLDVLGWAELFVL
ncbi:STAS domain-containing protein [Actinoplanes sp. G11-F43]|uniref:STAS domain-containing protein n=1 Tax=Actinoplanes sp. G11-F43 TaxID=3424130 RepID=UPI003D353E90